MNDTEHMNTSTASLFRQALADPTAVSMADFDRLLSEYPYAQPLHFALARKKFREGDAQPLSKKAVLLAPSADWLREYVQGPDAEVLPAMPELSPSTEIPPSPPTGAQRPSDWLDATASPLEDGGTSVDGEIQPAESPQTAAETAIEEELLPEAPPSPPTGGLRASDWPDATASPLGDGGTLEDDLSAEMAENEPVAPEEDELETLMRTNIGGGYSLDALYDEKGAAAEPEIAEREEDQSVPEEKTAEFSEAREEKISLYDDELMPYTFRWWLHKTRMEHAETYRPFADSPMFPTAAPFDPAKLDEIILDQQIREHVMHLQSLEDRLSEEVRKKEVRLAAPNKTTEAIDRFIREEPQIQPPPADQLTMENKARKSSEEQFDVVTETLAAIYAEQGLHAKSVAVYEKLILKFPEKKPYFAARIRELEEKPPLTSD